MQVLLVNHKDQPYTVNEGDRIAQLILEQATLPAIKEVTKLSSTKQDQKGFGSTDQVASIAENRANSMLIFKGLVKGQELDVLIDSGAVGNFINKNLIDKLKILTKPAGKNGGVVTADGTTLLN